LRAIGVLAPADEVRLAFKSGGVIQSIAVEQGAVIRKGQLLATLAQDEVAAAVAQARAVAEQSNRDLERGKALLADEVATREQVETLSTANQVCRRRSCARRCSTPATRASRHRRTAWCCASCGSRRAGSLPASPYWSVGNTSGGWIVRARSPTWRRRARTRAIGRVTLDAYSRQALQPLGRRDRGRGRPADRHYG
jgi:pyruvate/2-oxoglutarate dehydrogenase complex dihydrolipoamide acyltransferase (E2) component